MSESIKFSDVKINVTMDGKTIKSEEIIIPMTVTDDTNGEVNVTLIVNNEYKNIGKPVEFSFDLSKENILTQMEFEDVMTNAMSQMTE